MIESGLDRLRVAMSICYHELSYITFSVIISLLVS